ncbi:MAG TPA: hypothetical protein VFR94_20220 [Nitrososphaeraceae archaeon]|nr:hypothetical protein [Nitrososphaeraceae archaeon]
MYAKLPFYVKMFADAGFPLTSDKKVTDDLVNNMIISGNEDTLATSLTKLLDAGLDELMVSLVPVVDEKYEQIQLMRLIGQL